MFEFYVKDFGKDSEAIEKCLLKAAEVNGEKRIIFSGGDYYIDRAILLSDNTEVIVDGCAIRQNDEVFDNVFRGVNVVVDQDNPYGVPKEVAPQKNIKIKGINGAEIIGTEKPKIGYHTVLKEQQEMQGDFWGWRTHMFSMSRGENIEISGFKLSKTMGWAITFDYCHDVYVHDMEIFSDVKNGDGIDFRRGCYSCRAENISGSTSDDTVACTALGCSNKSFSPKKNYLYPSSPYSSLGKEETGDIHDITIKNITTGGYMHGIICLAAGGNKVYNVLIENVSDGGNGHREATVKIYTGYGDGYNPGDINNITVRNICSENSDYAVLISADVRDIVLQDIAQKNKDGLLVFGAEEGKVSIL